MDEETKKYIDDYISKYAKTDSAWQKNRREHPIAVQNILGFGGLFLGYAIGFAVAKFF